MDCEWTKGRPSDYHSGLCEDLINQLSLGHTNSMISSSWGISQTTFYKWLKEHTELADAYERGKTAQEAWWDTKGIESMLGKGNIDFKFWIAFRNKQHGWAGTNPSSGGTVNIGNVNVMSLSPKDLDNKLAIFMEKYGATNIIDLKTKVLTHTSQTESIKSNESK